MGDKTGIEWTDATWNPVTGCTKISPGCVHCYAEAVDHRFDHDKMGKLPWAFPASRGGRGVTLHPERLEQPLRWKKPRRIFVNSMSDLFHEDVPDEGIAEIFQIMADCPQHTFQVLTKRPHRMRRFLDENEGLGTVARFTGYSYPLPNVWLGVSVESQYWADRRIPLLLQTPAALRFLSVEPLLGPVDLLKVMEPDEYAWDIVHSIIWDDPEPPQFIEECDVECDWVNFGNDLVLNPEWLETERWALWRAKLEMLKQSINWVIVGGESGPKARPMHPDWARSIRDQCQMAGVPFFFKQWGEWTPNNLCDPELELMHKVGKKAAGAILDGQVYQEMPEAY